MTPEKKDSAEGHRARLRDKFIESGLAGFHDYEVVELLLTLGSLRRDCKQMAKEAIRRNAFGLKLVREVAARFLKDKVVQRPIYNSAQQVFDYLYYSMGGLKKEVFKVIYLNGQNQIIDVTEIASGTVNSGAVSPREVMEVAIRHHAVSMIFAHNHPSGDPQPSRQDKEVTRDLVFAAAIMRLKALDHIIIGQDSYYSFAAEGLIEEYETGFLNLRMVQAVRGTVRLAPAARKTAATAV